MNRIDFIVGREDLLDMLRPMWEQLNQVHKSRSLHFRERYEKMTFEERRSFLLKKAEKGVLRVELAREEGYGYIGYCICSINSEMEAEVDSLYVEPGYRKLGIGGSLVERALNWMDKSGAVSKTVSVAAGNERVFSFYGRYGFYPLLNILKQK